MYNGLCYKVSTLEHKYSRILGILTHYMVGGQGVPIILLHGLGGSVMSWRENLQAFSQWGTVYAIDLPGHGDSEKPRDVPYNLSFAISFLEAFCQAEGLPSAILVGNSTGGLIALEFAYRHPELVKGLILVGSPGFGRGIALFLRLLSVPRLGEFMARPTRGRLRALLNTIFYDSRAVPQDLLDEMCRIRSTPGATEAMLTALRSGVTLRGLRSELVMLDKARTLSMPTLICWGQEDRLVPVGQAHKAHAAMRGSVIQVFPRCGHWPQMERASDFNRLAQGLLSPVASHNY